MDKKNWSKLDQGIWQKKEACFAKSSRNNLEVGWMKPLYSLQHFICRGGVEKHSVEKHRVCRHIIGWQRCPQWRVYTFITQVACHHTRHELASHDQQYDISGTVCVSNNETGDENIRRGQIAWMHLKINIRSKSVCSIVSLHLTSNK